MELRCEFCNLELSTIDLVVDNKCNEFGEEYYVYYLTCDCGKELYEGYEWGYCYEEDEIDVWNYVVEQLKISGGYS